MDNSEWLTGVLSLAPTRWQVMVSTTVLPSNTGGRITPKQNHPRLRASLLLFLKGFEAEKPELPQHQSFPAIPHGVGQGNGAFLLGCLDCLWPIKLVKTSKTSCFTGSWKDMGMWVFLRAPGGNAALHLIRAQMSPASRARTRDASLALLSPA